MDKVMKTYYNKLHLTSYKQSTTEYKIRDVRELGKRGGTEKKIGI